MLVGTLLIEMDVDVNKDMCWWMWMLVGTHVGRDGCGC